MNKKIFLIGCLFFSIILFSASYAQAYQTFVGLQIVSAQDKAAPISPNNNWCLMGRGYNTAPGTQLTIGTGTVTNTATSSMISNWSALPSIAASGTTNPPPYGVAVPVCPVGTTNNPAGSNNILWSGLVDIAVSTNYVAKIYVYSDCPGVEDGNGYCFVAANTQQDCDTTCAAVGSAKNSSTCYNYATPNCTACATPPCNNCCPFLANLKGSACTTCTAVSGASSYPYFNASTGACYYVSSAGTPPNCSAPASPYIRACFCGTNYPQNAYYFPFTTPSSF